MPRVKPVDPSSASGRTKEVLDQVHKKFGMVPNVIRGLANSPAAAQAYLNLGDALSHGLLPAKVREQIALVVAQSNGCQYCLSAHSAVGKMLGLQDKEIADSREARSSDTKTKTILSFARTLVEERGNVDDADLHDVRAAGVSDGEIAEIVANVAQNILTNYFNHVAETEIDFPQVPLKLKQTA